MMITTNPTVTIVVSAIMGLISAYVARKRGQNPYLWFLAGSVLGVLGIIAFFYLSSPKKKPVPKPRIPVSYIEGPTDKFWYYLDSAHKQYGPYSHHALTKAWQKGELTPTTLVWHEDLTDWKPLLEFIKVKN